MEDGVTAVGDRAFYRLSALEKVWLPNSLKRLGYWAMEDTPELQEVEYTGSEAEWQSLQKGFGCLPQQFALEPDDLVKESYLPVWARLDADGRAGTISSDFSPDALVRHEGSLSVMAVSPSFRTETFSAEQAQKGHDRDPQGSGKMSLDQEPELS